MELKSQVALSNAITIAIIGIAFWYILLGYKSHRLIRVRGLFSIFLWSGLWTIASIIWHFGIVFRLPCFLIAAILNVFQVFVSFATVERCLMILIHYAINHEAVNSANQSNSIGVNGHQSPFSQAWSKWIFKTESTLLLIGILDQRLLYFQSLWYLHWWEFFALDCLATITTQRSALRSVMKC
jgi:hypothetical protein